MCWDAFSSLLAHFWTTISVFSPRDCNTTRYRKRRKRGGIKCKSATEHTQNVFSRKIKPNSQAISESQSFSGKPFFVESSSKILFLSSRSESFYTSSYPPPFSNRACHKTTGLRKRILGLSLHYTFWTALGEEKYSESGETNYPVIPQSTTTHV